jgi:hypothetical protein
MPRVVFTQNLQRHVTCPPASVTGSTLREVLDAVFAQNDLARGYILDEQGNLRKHIMVFIDGEMIRDHTHLADPVPPTGEVYIMQALSGGDSQVTSRE